MRKALFLVPALVLAAAPVQAMQRDTGGGASDGACTEKFHECLRGCGPSGSDPECERYCEVRVLARCRAGAAIKGSAVKPGAVKGGMKAPTR